MVSGPDELEALSHELDEPVQRDEEASDVVLATAEHDLADSLEVAEDIFQHDE